jgi:hypothetical protein
VLAVQLKLIWLEEVAVAVKLEGEAGTGVFTVSVTAEEAALA